MVINVSNMAGNTFLNLFLLGLVEGPGNLLGMVLAEKVGRRWTHSGLLFINAMFFAIVMGLTQYQYTTWWGSGVIAFLCMWLKMNISATFVVAYIQVLIKVHDSFILYYWVIYCRQWRCFQLVFVNPVLVFVLSYHRLSALVVLTALPLARKILE